MKVLHLIAAPTMTGPADPALGLARGQAALGVDVRIGFDTRREGNMAGKVADSGVPAVEGLTLSTKAGAIAAVRDGLRLRALAADVDVVHAHSSHDHSLALGIGGRATLVRSIHHPRGCRRRGLQSFAYQRTAGFFVVAGAHRELLLESYPDLPADRVRVVPGAVDVDRFSPAADGAGVRAETGFGPDRVLLGMVARIKPGRGHDLLLDAFRAAREVRPELALALIGKGEGVPQTEARIVELGLDAHVARLGFRDEDLPEAIRACDATVLLEEGNDASCRAILESMACGVPVLGADHPAIHDALEGDSGGVLVARRDHAAWVEALIQAATWDSEALRARARAARARVEARHTDVIRAERVLEAYRRWGSV